MKATDALCVRVRVCTGVRVSYSAAVDAPLQYRGAHPVKSRADRPMDGGTTECVMPFQPAPGGWRRETRQSPPEGLLHCPSLCTLLCIGCSARQPRPFSDPLRTLENRPCVARLRSSSHTRTRAYSTYGRTDK